MYDKMATKLPQMEYEVQIGQSDNDTFTRIFPKAKKYICYKC